MQKVADARTGNLLPLGGRRRHGSTASLLVGTALSLLVCLALSTHYRLLDYTVARISVKVTSSEQYFYHKQDWQQWSDGGTQKCRAPGVDEVIPHLLSVRQWHSCKLRQLESVTLVTQLSLERLEMLENQCRIWPDPLAAVVYVPTLQGRVASAEDASLNGSVLAEAVGRASAFFNRMQLQGACTLDLELVTQDFKSEEEAGLYPFNAARNRALLLAQTEAILLLDADFVPSPTIVASYKTPQGYAELLRRLNRPGAVVLPAFETADNGTEGQQLALAAVHRGKAFAAEEYQQHNLLGFHMAHYAGGHGPTNYTRWVATSKYYWIRYQSGYEPYVIVSRRFCPWYDERFRGYGYDKIQQLEHLASEHVNFFVHPHGFVVHVPHEKAPTFGITHRTGHWDKLYKMFKDVQSQLKRHRFVPVTSFPQLCQHQ